MYETFYALTKRPFAAAADPQATVETPAVVDVIERLDRCIRQGRGIGVLTASSGLGKTHLCHRLALLWQSEFQVTLLPSIGFPSGRGLLQAILADLDQPYQGLKETELRIELTAVARTIRAQSSGLILILDEAHRATERVCEEIRLIANLIDSAEPLVRVVLAGNLELEDKLADPDLAGLNERVGELVTIPRLTADEARRYLQERAARADGTLDDLFEPEAVELIVQACGGVPRSLNQLADHSLLLGSVAEHKPVGTLLVREALDDLKRLPLQWQDPLPAAEHEPPAQAAASAFLQNELAENVIEIGSLEDESGDEFASVGSTDDATEFAFDDRCIERFPAMLTGDAADGIAREEVEGEFNAAENVAAFSEPEPPATEPLIDRFAQLDAGEARRRWLEELDRDERNDAGRERTASDESLPADEPTASPLSLIDSTEALVAKELADDGSADSNSEPPLVDDEARDARERRFLDGFGGESATPAPPGPTEPSSLPIDSVRSSCSRSACATLFRDLRRRGSSDEES